MATGREEDAEDREDTEDREDREDTEDLRVWKMGSAEDDELTTLGFAIDRGEDGE